MLNVIDRDRQDAFVRVGDALLKLFCIQSAVLPDDADHGDVDRREYIGGRPHQDERCQQDKQQRRHDKRIGSPQC